MNKQLYRLYLLIFVVVLLGCMLVMTLNTPKTSSPQSNASSPAAQNNESENQWEYLQLTREEAVIGFDYFMDGEFQANSDDPAYLHELLKSLGTEGWVLVSAENDRSFIFERPKEP